MKRGSLVFFLIFLLLGLASFIPTSLRPNTMLYSPFEQRSPWSYPSFATAGTDGSVYVIDNGLQRVRKVNTQGFLEWELKGGSRDNGFFSAVELVLDVAGNLYVLNQVLMEDGFRTEREEIIRYSPNGDFDRIVYSRRYRPEEMDNHTATRGRLQNLTVKNPYISWFELNETAAIESRYNLQTGKLEQETVLAMDEVPAWIASISRADTDTLVYVTKAGEIRRLNTTEGDTLLYSGDDASEGGTSVPWWVGISRNGKLVFSDIMRRTISTLDPEGKPHVLFSNDALRARTGDEYPYIYYTFSLTDAEEIVTVSDLSVIRIAPDGTLTSIVNDGAFPVAELVYRALWWSGLGFLGIALLTGAWLFYSRIMRKRVSLILKQLFILLPFVAGILAYTTGYLFESFTKRFQGQTYEQISQIVQIVSQNIDVSRLDAIRNQRDFMNEDYQAVRESLHRALNYNQDRWNRNIYFALHRIIDGEIYAFMYLNDGVTPVHPFTYLNDPTLSFWKAARGDIVTAEAVDAWGSWVFGVGPVLNESGKVVAILEIGRDMYGYQQDYQRVISSITPFVVASFGVLVLIFILFTWIILAPLRVLRTGVIRISEGQLDTSLKVRGHDEVADLTNVFNQMTANIRSFVNEITALSTGYRRFVPQEFLTFLNKSSVKEIQLGDQTQREMTVLFSDIRDFTTISEKLNPQQNFEFLNSYLGLVGPEIRKHDGFIDKYIGDAIMALFPKSADDAVGTATSIINLLHGFNKQRASEGLFPINIGLGIHTGNLMLGILGESERFDGTVISDNVNLASRLEGLTKHFDASILISETSHASLPNPDRYLLRYLGKVKVKGKKEAIGVYEVLDGADGVVKSLKMQANASLQQGIRAFQARNIPEATAAFQEAIKANPGDVPAKLYLNLCKQVPAAASNEPWTGAIIMSSK